MIAGHLPVLPVLLPLLSAPVCALLRSDRAAWLLSWVTGTLCLAATVLLLLRVHAAGTLSYAIGGWSAPWGIEYRVDLLGAYLALIVTAMGAVVMAFAGPSVTREVGRGRAPLFYSALLLCMAGLLGITVTGDIFNVFVFLEISSLSSYALIAMGRDRRALTAAYQYLIMGTIGATFILIGIGLAYMMTGTLNLADLADRLPAVSDTRTARASFAFLTVGITLKLALFPLHLWLPNAYAFAPSVVTAFLAATATKVAAFLLLRFVYSSGFATADQNLELVLLPLALLAVFSPSVVAVFQVSVKRLLAYSSVAQMGYIIVGLSIGTAAGVTGAVVHLFNHALTKGALFLALGCVAYRLGTTRLDRMAGLGRQMPWTMGAFVVGGLSLIGVPLTAGFVSKWYLVLAALERGWWPVALFIVLTSLIAVAYVWRVLEVVYLRQPSADGPAVAEAPAQLLLPTWVLAGACLYFGLDSSISAGLAERVATALLGGTP